MHIPHLLELRSDVVNSDLCVAHCEADGDVVAACEVNLGVGGLEVRGDLMELVEIGEGLEAVVLKKTRAGGNWLTGGIVMVWCDVFAMLGRMDVDVFV